MQPKAKQQTDRAADGNHQPAVAEVKGVVIMATNKGNEALKKLASMSKADQAKVHNQNMGANKKPPKAGK